MVENRKQQVELANFKKNVSGGIETEYWIVLCNGRCTADGYVTIIVYLDKITVYPSHETMSAA